MLSVGMLSVVMLSVIMLAALARFFSNVIKI
jgi:hypothetical protein